MAKVTALLPALLRGLDVNDLKKSPKINFKEVISPLGMKS